MRVSASSTHRAWWRVLCLAVFLHVTWCGVDAGNCLEFRNVDTDRVDVLWNNPKVQTSHASKYELYIKKKGGDYEEVYSGREGGQRVTGLAPGVAYYFAVHSVGATGQSLSACIDLVTTKSRCNLLKNPSFEEVWHDTMAESWQPLVVDYDLSWNTARTGSKSLKLQRWSNWQGVGQHVFTNFTAPTTLTLTAWVQAFEVEVASMHLDLKYQNGKQSYHSLFLPDGSYDWRQVKLTVPAGELPVFSAMVGLILKQGPTDTSQSNILFDDFELSAVPVSFRESELAAQRNPCPCPRPCDERQYVLPNYLTHEFWYTAEETPIEDDVTIVTQTTKDRLSRLVLLTERYQGPVSVTLYVRDRESDLLALIRARRDSAALRRFADFHLVFAEDGPYPINTLRNVALTNARTGFVCLADVDFVYNRDFHADIARMMPLFKAERRRSVWVVPAFEMEGEDNIPNTKAELIDQVALQRIIPVHIFKFARAHEATNYPAWYASNSIYTIEYQLYFEPYVICDKNVPLYDERFAGYGNDKVEQLYELFAAGYTFKVLPQSFTVHLSHPSSWEADRDWDRVWLNWYSFVYGADRQWRNGMFGWVHDDDDEKSTCSAEQLSAEKGSSAQAALGVESLPYPLQPLVIANGEKPTVVAMD